MEEKKKLNMLDIYSLGVGGCIGSGIFVLMGFGIAYTGRSIVVAVSVGCLYMLLAYLFHPFMASMFVLPGGDYDMKAMLMNPLMTGFSALNTVLGGLGMASYGLAFASYFCSVFTGLAQYERVIGGLLIVAFFALSIRGTKALATITSVITIVLLISIGIFLVVGLPKVQPGYFSNADGKFWMGGFGGVLGAISMMAWACQGTTMGPVSVMSATKNPRKTIPVGILWITLSVAIIYGLMSIVAAGVLPVDQVAGQNLSLVAQAIFTPTLFAVFILGAACCAIMSSLASGMTMLRYPLLAVAEDGWLPAVFKKTTKDGYPYVGMGVYFLFSILPIFTPLTVDALISVLMIPGMIMNAYMNIAMIKLVKKYSEQWKNATLHMPNGIFNMICVLGSICSLLVAYFLFKDMTPGTMILTVVMLAVMFGLSAIQLKRGAVKVEDLEAKKARIAAAAIAATEAEKAGA